MEYSFLLTARDLLYAPFDRSFVSLLGVCVFVCVVLFPFFPPFLFCLFCAGFFSFVCLFVCVIFVCCCLFGWGFFGGVGCLLFVFT